MHQRSKELSSDDMNELEKAKGVSDFVNQIIEKLYPKEILISGTPSVVFDKYIKGSKGFKQIQGNNTLV